MAVQNSGDNKGNSELMESEIVPVSGDNSNENVIEEYNQLDSQLDQLNTALDFIEQKNDNIHQQLKVLLQSSIEIRQQIQNENSETKNQ